MANETPYDGLEGIRRELLKHTADQSGSPVEPPPGHRVVRVDTPSTRKLQDLASFRRDFEAAKLYADANIAVADARPDRPYAAEDAFWIAAVVTYARAFAKGVRLVERPSVDIYTEVERAEHQRCLDLRDKHLAHAVNNFEHVTVVAYLTASAFAPRQVARVGQMNHEASLIDARDSAAISELCSKQLKDLTLRIRRVQNEIGDELLDMGEDAVYALPDVTTPGFTVGEPTKRRR